TRGGPCIGAQLGGCDPAGGIATCRGVERAERIGAHGRADCSLGYLLRGMPVALVARKRQREIAERCGLLILAPHRDMLEPLLLLPRAVVGLVLTEQGEGAVA